VTIDFWILEDNRSQVDDYVKGPEFLTLLSEIIVQAIASVADAIIFVFFEGLFGVFTV